MGKVNHGAGTVLVFNPKGADMEIEQNPRGRKRRKNPSSKKRKKARSMVTTVTTRANPKRRARRNPSHHAAPRRRRRNPGAMPSLMSALTYTAGGAVTWGVQYGVSKIPDLGVPARLGLAASAAVVVPVALSFVSEKAAAGAFGALGFQIPGLVMAGWNYYQATKAAEDKKAPPAPPAPAPGAKGLPYGLPASASYAAREQLRF